MSKSAKKNKKKFEKQAKIAKPDSDTTTPKDEKPDASDKPARKSVNYCSTIT